MGFISKLLTKAAPVLQVASFLPIPGVQTAAMIASAGVSALNAAKGMKRRKPGIPPQADLTGIEEPLIFNRSKPSHTEGLALFLDTLKQGEPTSWNTGEGLEHVKRNYVENRKQLSKTQDDLNETFQTT